jgi:formylglycine-generating enzyme required for sulfatase activity
MRHFTKLLVRKRKVIALAVVAAAVTVAGGIFLHRHLNPAPASDGPLLRAEDLVGKWRLVRAGGQPPTESWIYTREMDIAADGTWTAKQRGYGPLRGMTQTCGGTWSLADGVVTYTNGGPEKLKSQVKLESGCLIVDSDFNMGMSKKGPAVTGEYERPSATDPKEKEDLVAAMKFVKVPRGTFWMGWDSKNKQSKQVEIKEDFELAAYTVMQWQWQELMGNNPSDFSRNGPNSGSVPYDDEDLRRFPVENVTWDNTQAFLKKLNEREKGKGWLYRLPREAEWEYACRGAATTKEECSFDFYLDKPTNHLSAKDANFAQPRPAGNDGGFFAAFGSNVTVKVGSYAPNKLGLYDMHGNVQQWCEDLAHPNGTERVMRATWAAGRRSATANSRRFGSITAASELPGLRPAASDNLVRCVNGKRDIGKEKRASSFSRLKISNKYDVPLSYPTT